MTSSRKNKINRIQNGERPRVLDLFAGAGGLSLGFQTAGFQITAGVEIDPRAAKTHAINLFSHLSEPLQSLHAQSRDINVIEPRDFLEEIGSKNPKDSIDVIIGGPPCQAYTRAGRAKLREIAKHPEAYLQDPRGNLYLHFLNYVRELQPVAILMENVPEALNYGGHNIAEEICEVLDELGYECGYSILNSSHYGVPQLRDRMFLLALAEEINNEIKFPVPTNWIEIPIGYHNGRKSFLKPLQLKIWENSTDTGAKYFKKPPQPNTELPPAITASEALIDLPPLKAMELYEKGFLDHNVQSMDRIFDYPENQEISNYGLLMRGWPGFESIEGINGHVIRRLPRDFRIFARMNSGDEYPQAQQHAISIFEEEILLRRANGEIIEEGSQTYEEIRKAFVPPYDPDKFPNRWRKLDPDQPSRTVMAHLSKDGYTHIHYDSDQARTISPREAARLQSFPDGFVFSNSMQSAMRQIGNAVPPLLGYHLAGNIMKSLGGQLHSLWKCS